MSELIKKEQTDLDASMFDGLSTGFEETYAETFKTPFLKILQQLSPELKKTGEAYLEGAEIGLFCNTATKQLYNEVNIIVLKVEHVLVGWKPNRGGFVGSWPKDDEGKIVHMIDGVKKTDKEGNEINDTLNFYCINAEDPTDLFIISLSTASLKHGRTFAHRLRSLKANGKSLSVSYAGVWNIKTVEESNDKGDWFTIGNTPKFDRFITKEELEQVVKPALELLKKAETDYSQMNEKEVTEEESVNY
jgi:hypothetical protein